jgi:hypothetical protein
MQTADPSPEQIAAECERIRATWSEQETRKRSAWATSPRWVAPKVEVDELGE